MAGDVFEKDPFRFNFSNDAGNVWPEVAGVVCAFALPSLGKRLAWVSGKHGVNDAAPWAPVEGLDVIPDRGWMQISGALACNDGAARVLFPLDIDGSGKSRLGKPEAHVKPAAACTEADAVSGM